MNRWKYLNLWKYTNSPLLIENYSQGPSQGKLIFNIISFPHRSPKRQLILFALKSMEKLPELGFQGGAEAAGHLSCCTSPPSQHPKSSGTSRAGLELMIPRQVWFFSARSHSHKAPWEQQEFCARPEVTFGAVFSRPSIPLSGKMFFLHQRSRERLSPGRSKMSFTRRYFSFLFQMH